MGDLEFPGVRPPVRLRGRLDDGAVAGYSSFVYVRPERVVEFGQEQRAPGVVAAQAHARFGQFLDQAAQSGRAWWVLPAQSRSMMVPVPSPPPQHMVIKA